MDIKQILLRYGNENLNLLNEFPSSSNDQASINDRDDEDESFLEVQRRIKEKYGMKRNRSPSPVEDMRRTSNYSPTQTLSSRYEQLTGKSPSADILTSSLDELLKSLKNKFGPKKEEPKPFETIQRLLQSHIIKKEEPKPVQSKRDEADDFQRDNSLSRLSNHSGQSNGSRGPPRHASSPQKKSPQVQKGHSNLLIDHFIHTIP